MFLNALAYSSSYYSSSAGLDWLLIVIVLGVIFGFICGSIASNKGYEYWPYFGLGLFLGLIGLIVCLVMPDKKAQQQIVQATKEAVEKTAEQQAAPSPTTAADELLKFKQLLDAGAISQAEYDTAKARVLGTPTPQADGSPDAPESAVVSSVETVTLTEKK